MLLLTPEKGTETASDDSVPYQVVSDQPVDRAMHKFRDACGATGPIRLRVSGPGMPEPREYSYESPFVIIGRSRRAHLRLTHTDVSMRHTYLQIVAGRLYCVDLCSRTGTSGGSGLRGGEILAQSETIQIGPFQVEAIDETEWDEAEGVRDSDSEISLEPEADELARVTVEVLNRAKGGRFRAIEDAITLAGNAPSCQLRLKDKSLSKTHCSLVRTPDALWCVDLFGRGGTKINGAEIRIGKLKDGDQLRIGNAKIRVHYSTLTDEESGGDGGFDDYSRVETVQMPNNAEDDPAPPDLTSQIPEPEQAASPEPFGGLPLPAMPPPVQLPQVSGEQSPAERNVSEAFVMTLVNQFGQMQQQMYQQSQQSMMMLVNMFSTLHQNHMDLIRDDLNRLHDITAEVQSVQAKMLSDQSATNVSFTREHPPAADPTPVQDAVISEAKNKPQQRTQAQGKYKYVTAPGQPAKTGEETSRPDADTPNETESRRPDRSGVKTHALLSERLAALENERNSRWQKIMQTIKGIGGG